MRWIEVKVIKLTPITLSVFSKSEFIFNCIVENLQFLYPIYSNISISVVQVLVLTINQLPMTVKIYV